MEARDRLVNLAIFGTAGLVWVLVGLVITSRDPRQDTGAGFVGAVLIGLAIGLTTIPLFWLAVFGRHRRLAYRGDWMRAVRRGSWVAVVVALFVVLRLQGALQLPIALFVLTLVTVAEATLSAER
jgi:fructose-specific phosphotransferase system IIC component